MIVGSARPSRYVVTSEGLGDRQATRQNQNQGTEKFPKPVEERQARHFRNVRTRLLIPVGVSDGTDASPRWKKSQRLIDWAPRLAHQVCLGKHEPLFCLLPDSRQHARTCGDPRPEFHTRSQRRRRYQRRRSTGNFQVKSQRVSHCGSRRNPPQRVERYIVHLVCIQGLFDLFLPGILTGWGGRQRTAHATTEGAGSKPSARVVEPEIPGHTERIQWCHVGHLSYQF